MITATLCLLQDQLDASEDAVRALEGDIRELHDEHPAVASVRFVQRQYRSLILSLKDAIAELRKLAPQRFTRN